MKKEIKEFAEEMERILKKHDFIKGDSWKMMSHKQLQELMLKEVEESKEDDAKLGEWIDIANICMMIWYNSTHKKEVSNFDKIEKRLNNLEIARKTLNKINKVIKDFWDSEKDCDDVDALSKIMKIMEKYNEKK